MTPYTSQELPNEKPRFTSKAEFCYHFRISMGKLNKMLRLGELPSAKIGTRCVIPTSAVEEYAAKITNEVPHERI
jgi:excisionase family DNA binding protein